MNWLFCQLRKVQLLISRKKFHRELDEEMTFHRAQAEEEMRAGGMPPEEARHAANRQFGNDLLLKERSREVTGFWFESVLQDCRYALRQFIKAPGFVLAVVLTLALGIGATTAIFTLVYSTLLRSLPYPDANRIVRVEDVRLQGQSTSGLVGVQRFFDLKARNWSFDSLGFFFFDHPTLIAGTHLPISMKAVGANAEFWKVLGVQPLLGRTFNEQDDGPTAPDAVVLSYGAWQQMFDGDSRVIGRQVTLDRKAATIVGVMPQGFHMPSGIDLWKPAHFDPSEWSKNRLDSSHFINVYGRLQSGVSLNAAEDDLKRIGDQLQREYPGSDAMWRFDMKSLRDYLYGELRPALIVLLIASGFLLMIACINIANLLLSRAASREREVTLRRALGASEGRIRLQFLTESMLVALVGGSIGLGAAFALVHAVAAKLPGRLGVPGTVTMNWPAAWLAFAISVAAGIGLGFAPVFQNKHIELNTSLKRGELHMAGSAGNKVRSAFISIQVGLSLVLLIGASLLAESLWKLVKSPLGFQPDHVLTFAINLPWNSKEAQIENFYTNVQQRIEALPGVIAAGETDAPPIVEWRLRSNFDADWLPRVPDKPAINAEDRNVGGDYFRAMGIPIVAGRSFTEADIKSNPGRIMINQQLAQQYLPGGNPLGRHLIVLGKPFEIIGVIANVRGIGGSIAKGVGPEVYWQADADGGVVQRYFVVRSHVPAEQMIKAVQEQVHQVDPQQAIGKISSMDDMLSEAVAQPGLNMALVAAFSVIALALACVGIYGVVAYSVAQRTQEIGVRMALGATRSQISLLFVRRVMVSALIGLSAGICISLLLTRLLRSQLYGVTPNDPVVYLGAIAMLIVPVVLATLRPAQRAASVNPVEALRAE